LKDNLAQEDKTMADLEEQIRDFRVHNPNVNLQTDPNNSNVPLQRLQQLSLSLTDARMKTIDAKASYGPSHYMVLRAVSREKEISDLYDEALDAVSRQNTKAADLQRITSKLDEQKDFRTKLFDRVHQFEMATDGRKLIDIELVEPPLVADSPSFPRTKRILAASIVVGALIGAGLALLRDRSDGRMHSVEEIQTVVGLPILGVVPAMSGRRTAIARAMTVHLDPRSVVAEAYRTIRTAVYFGTNGSRAKTILISSPEPGDGKTTSASNLAIAIAQTGRSVLLLDADFRKPTQHKNLDIKDSVGLSSVLSGRETLERAIQRTGVEGLDILPCGPIPANPSEILNSREFGELIDSLAMRYDHILFDSPPVNAVTDARILGAVCDATILVLRADKTTKKSGEHARNALMAVSAKLLGAIVNDAPNRKGYEVYGGSYYGNVDVGQRRDGGRNNGANGRKKLPKPVPDFAD
ncbi:MAG TPA: polysaccharide biosynthesis tyrosine autokinase, partial [Tepidisphaeraceae bacterium]|nr:polysaccharide biosynthesis tyrosine autokinase [Tepidisphaeraceae bacterium]